MKTVDERMHEIWEEVKPLTQHPDLRVFPILYDYGVKDCLYIEINPVNPFKWYDVAYEFLHHENAKIDSHNDYYRSDGRPIYTINNQISVRTITPFLDYSKVAMHIHAKLNTENEVVDQLERFLILYQKIDKINLYDLLDKWNIEAGVL